MVVWRLQFTKGVVTKTTPSGGTWNLVSLKWTYTDSTSYEYPGNLVECSGRWIVSNDNSLFYYKYKTNEDTVYTIEVWDVKYKYESNIYEETYIEAPDNNLIGQKIHYKVSINNDTLTLSGPNKEESSILGCVVLEKYVRD